MILASLEVLSLLQDLTVNKHFYRHSRDYYYYPLSYLLIRKKLRLRISIEDNIYRKRVKDIAQTIIID